MNASIYSNRFPLGRIRMAIGWRRACISSSVHIPTWWTYSRNSTLKTGCSGRSIRYVYVCIYIYVCVPPFVIPMNIASNLTLLTAIKMVFAMQGLPGEFTTFDFIPGVPAPLHFALAILSNQKMLTFMVTIWTNPTLRILHITCKIDAIHTLHIYIVYTTNFLKYTVWLFIPTKLLKGQYNFGRFHMNIHIPYAYRHYILVMYRRSCRRPLRCCPWCWRASPSSTSRTSSASLSSCASSACPRESTKRSSWPWPRP